MYLIDDRDDVIDDGIVDDDDNDRSDLSILGASTAITELKVCDWNE